LQAASYFLPATIARIAAIPMGGTMDVRGGTDTRDFLPTSQIAWALATLRAHRATGVFNVASGEGVRINDVVARLATLLGRTDVALQPQSNDSPTHLVAKINRLRTLGWTPSGGWETLLQTMTTKRASDE
jgi:UDP-glucose 4-epimerase